jgi:hypothetical protein
MLTKLMEYQKKTTYEPTYPIKTPCTLIWTTSFIKIWIIWLSKHHARQYEFRIFLEFEYRISLHFILY